MDSAQLPPDNWLSLLYEDLRRLAAAQKRSDGSATLNPTALVHEAWMRMSKQDVSKGEFLSHAITLMRHILVDAARARNARKRRVVEVTGPEGRMWSLEESLDFYDGLAQLEQRNPRQARVAHLKWFGYTFEEIGELCGMAPETARKDWQFAKAWLKARYRAAGQGSG